MQLCVASKLILRSMGLAQGQPLARNRRGDADTFAVGRRAAQLTSMAARGSEDHASRPHQYKHGWAKFGCTRLVGRRWASRGVRSAESCANSGEGTPAVSRCRLACDINQSLAIDAA